MNGVALKRLVEPEYPPRLTAEQTAELDAIVFRRLERAGGDADTAREWAWDQVIFGGMLWARGEVER